MNEAGTASSRNPLPDLRGRADYVLILEWLESDEPRTGKELHEFLSGIGRKSMLVSCSSGEAVQRAIEHARRHIRRLGVPVVHIEAHGGNPDDGDVALLEFGSNASFGLTWVDLGTWLAPLNEATGFRLLVVGAACFGIGVVAAMKIYEHVAPFAACIGFTTKVYPGSLRDAMREFYRLLFQNYTTAEAVEGARRELRDARENLRVYTSTSLALRVLRGAYDDVRTCEGMAARIDALLADARKDGLILASEIRDAMPGIMQEQARVRMREAWDSWFPRSLQERAPEYRLDWRLVFEDAK